MAELALEIFGIFAVITCVVLIFIAGEFQRFNDREERKGEK